MCCPPAHWNDTYQFGISSGFISITLLSLISGITVTEAKLVMSSFITIKRRNSYQTMNSSSPRNKPRQFTFHNKVTLLIPPLLLLQSPNIQLLNYFVHRISFIHTIEHRCPILSFCTTSTRGAIPQ